MPKFKCPNCHSRVAVLQRQYGKGLRCPKCNGRFAVDPSLPVGIELLEFAESPEPPPVVSDPSHDSAGPTHPSVVNFDLNYGRSISSEWPLFWAMLICEVAIGFMIGYANYHTEIDWLAWRPGLERIRFPLWDSAVFRVLLLVLALAHILLSIVSIFRVASWLKGRNGAAAWIMTVFFLGAIGFGAFLVNQPTDYQSASAPP